MKLEFTKIFSNLGLIVNFAKSKSKKERASKYKTHRGRLNDLPHTLRSLEFKLSSNLFNR